MIFTAFSSIFLFSVSMVLMSCVIRHFLKKFIDNFNLVNFLSALIPALILLMFSYKEIIEFGDIGRAIIIGASSIVIFFFLKRSK